MTTPLKIQIIVDDKGSVKIQKFGSEAEKAGQKGEKSFRRTGRSLDEMNRKTAAATSHVLKLAGAVVSIGALYIAIRKINSAISEFVDLAGKQEAVEKRVEAVLKATGQAAGYNLAQLNAMAAGMQRLTTTGDEVILSGQAILLTFKKIRGEGFERATMAALDMAEVMEGDLKGSIVMIGKALNDPIANLSAMTRAGVQFTDAQKDMIKQLWKSGKEMEAQNIILTELESQFGGAAAAARDVFTGAVDAAGNALGDMKEEMGFVVTKSSVFIDFIKGAERWFIKSGKAIANWVAQNRRLIDQKISDILNGIATAAKTTWEVLKFLSDIISTVWALLSALPKGVIEYFENVNTAAAEAAEGVNELTTELETLANIEPSTLQKLINWLDQVGDSMVYFVEFAAKGVGAYIAVMAEDFIDFWYFVGKGFANLWNAVGASMVLQFDKAKGYLNEIVTDSMGLNEVLAKNHEAASKSIDTSWKNMTEKMAKRWGFANDVVRGAIDNAELLKIKVKEVADALKEVGAATDGFKGKTEDAKEAVKQIAEALAEEDLLLKELSQSMKDIDWGAFAPFMEPDYESTVKGVEDLADAMGDLNDLLEQSASTFDGESFGDALSEGINNAIISMNELIKMYERQADLQKEIDKKRKEAYMIGDIDERTKALDKLNRAESNMITDQISAYRQLFGTTKSLFQENSSERRAMHQAEMAFTAAEIVMRAVLAIASAGAGDPYTALARVAAMAAAMAGLLSQVGLSVSGGGSGGGGNAPPPSTVLGAEAGTSSTSIENTHDLLEDIHLLEYDALRDIYNEIKQLNANITGLVTSLLRTGMGGFSGAAEIAIKGPVEKAMQSFWDMIDQFRLVWMAMFEPLTAMISKFLGNVVIKGIAAIFGGGSQTYAMGAGIKIDPISIQDLVDGIGVDVTGYQDWRKETSKPFWQPDVVEFGTTYFALGEDIDRMFTSILLNISESMIMLDEGLGADNLQAILDYVIDIGKIDLKGLNAEQIDEKLRGIFSNLSDAMAKEFFGDIIEQYQKIDEGLYETAVRLVMQKEILLEVLDLTGQAFEGTAEEAVHFSQAIIAIAGDLETLADAAKTYYEAFYTAEEKLANLGQQLADFYSYYDVEIPDTREDFRALVEGIDLTTDAGKELYVALLGIADAQDSYFDALEKSAEKLAEMERSLLDMQRDMLGWSEQDMLDYFSKIAGFEITIEFLDDWIKGIEFWTVESLTALAEAMGLTYDEILQMFDFLFNYLNSFDKIEEQKNKLLYGGTDEEYRQQQLVDRYDVSGGMEGLEDWYNEMIKWIEMATPQEIKDLAEALGITTDQLFDDLEYLKKLFDDVGDAAGGLATDFEQLRETIEDMLSAISDTFNGGNSAANIMTQITDLQSIPMAEQTGDNLLAMSEKLVQWYYAAVAEATEAARQEQETARLWEQVATSVESLIESIDDAIRNIKYSDLNVSLPGEKRIEAQQDYATLLAAAQTGGVDDVQTYLSFASTYLQQSQDDLKSSQAYQDIYASVMADMEGIKSRAEAGGYDQLIYEELTRGNEELHVDLSAIEATFLEMEAWILDALTTLEDINLILKINWEDWDGTQADALGMLLQLVEVYGWDHEYTLNFIANVPLDIFDSLNQAAEAARWIADASGGWNTDATITFLVNMAGNWDWLDISEIFMAMGWVADQSGGWTSEASLAFILELMDRYGVPFDTLYQYLEMIGLDQATIDDIYVALILELYGGVIPINDIDDYLAALGITDEELIRTITINLIYDMVSSDAISMDEVKDYINNQMIAAWIAEQYSQEAINTLMGIQGLATMFGINDAYTVGYAIGMPNPADASALWTHHGQYASWAQGGIVTEPTLGWVGEAGYPEAVIPMMDGYSIPLKLINGGSTRAGSVNRDEEIALLREQNDLLAQLVTQSDRPIEIGGERLDRYVDGRSDNIRRLAERRGLGTKRMR